MKIQTKANESLVPRDYTKIFFDEDKARAFAKKVDGEVSSRNGAKNQKEFIVSWNDKKKAEEAVSGGQVDGVVVGGGGPVNTVDVRKDFEEAAKKLRELIKIGDTTTGDGKKVKAEQLDIQPEGTPNPAKDEEKKEKAETKKANESAEDHMSVPDKPMNVADLLDLAKEAAYSGKLKLAIQYAQDFINIAETAKVTKVNPLTGAEEGYGEYGHDDKYSIVKYGQWGEEWVGEADTEEEAKRKVKELEEKEGTPYSSFMYRKGKIREQFVFESMNKKRRRAAEEYNKSHGEQK